MRLTLWLTFTSFLLATPQKPAAPAQPASFEAASIRVVGPDTMGHFPDLPAAQFNVDGLSLKILTAIAYQYSDDHILNGPSWFDTTHYAVRAKPEGDTPLTEDQYAPLLRDLLKQRFHLAVHEETRMVSGYELVVAKGGPKLETVEKKDAMAYILSNGLECESATAGTVASLLGRPLGKPVVDKTGITTSFKLKLKFAPPTGSESDLPDILTAVQEQLGLRLEAKKVPAKFLIIDHADQQPTEN